MNKQDLPLHLRRQLGFLKNSIALYDQGHHEEAVRIAVSIRVLFHDCGRTISLLQGMRQKDVVQVVTTAGTLTDDLRSKLDYADLLRGMALGREIRYDPVSPDSPTVPASNWWLQPVLLRDKEPYTRRDVVLSAANKDGGAHVANPDGRLLAIMDGFFQRVHKNPDGLKVKIPEKDVHFRVLRRLGEELLCSKALLVLSESSLGDRFAGSGDVV